MQALYYSTVNKTNSFLNKTNSLEIQTSLINLNLINELVEITNLQDFTALAQRSWDFIIINSPYQVIGRQRNLIIKLLYQLSESKHIPLYYINTTGND